MWQLLGSAVAGLMIILAMPVYNDIQANNLNDTVDADAASQFQTILAGAQKYVVAQKDTLTDELSIGDAYQEVPFADLLNTQTLPGGSARPMFWGQHGMSMSNSQHRAPSAPWSQPPAGARSNRAI